MLQICFRTPKKILWEGEAESVRLPGTEGEFEVMAHHVPVMAVLGKGAIAVRASAALDVPVAPRMFTIQSGLAWLVKNRLMILTG